MFLQNSNLNQIVESKFLSIRLTHGLAESNQFNSIRKVNRLKSIQINGLNFFNSNQFKSESNESKFESKSDSDSRVAQLCLLGQIASMT